MISKGKFMNGDVVQNAGTRDRSATRSTRTSDSARAGPVNSGATGRARIGQKRKGPVCRQARAEGVVFGGAPPPQPPGPWPRINGRGQATFWLRLFAGGAAV